MGGSGVFAPAHLLLVPSLPSFWCSSLLAPLSFPVAPPRARQPPPISISTICGSPALLIGQIHVTASGTHPDPPLGPLPARIIYLGRSLPTQSTCSLFLCRVTRLVPALAPAPSSTSLAASTKGHHLTQAPS
ncbi:hypothetical protein EDB80DRAFT_68503 [Ilyonectria destructans]|nr:hypothetical protein EDB80DRAFT_68503 [Ilyonectria destructans]